MSVPTSAPYSNWLGRRAWRCSNTTAEAKRKAISLVNLPPTLASDLSLEERESTFIFMKNILGLGLYGQGLVVLLFVSTFIMAGFRRITPEENRRIAKRGKVPTDGRARRLLSAVA